MKTVALLFGLFWIGFYFPAVVYGLTKVQIPFAGQLLLGASFPCIAYYFI